MTARAWHDWTDAPSDARYAVLGDPVEHSWSPRMHNAAFEALELPDRYVALRVPSGQVADALKELSQKGYRGVNVTVPLKQEAFLATHPEKGMVTQIGAVNAVRLPGLSSTNTDGIGLFRALIERHLLPGAKVLLLGAGGSARAAAFTLARYGFDLTLWNRTAAKARDLAEEVGVHWTTQPETEGYAAVLNATAATLSGDPLPVKWGGRGLAMDFMYGDHSNPFLDSALAAGWSAVDGREMLLWQGVTSFLWLTGLEPPVGVMREAVCG